MRIILRLIVHAGDGRPQLLRVQAFNQLSELLSDRLVSSDWRANKHVELALGDLCLLSDRLVSILSRLHSLNSLHYPASSCPTGCRAIEHALEAAAFMRVVHNTPHVPERGTQATSDTRVVHGGTGSAYRIS